MRNLVTSSDSSAQLAATTALAEGGNAVDAVIAATLAGATVATPASLLGSAVVLVAGLGVGAYMIDGRARAPGVGAIKRASPSDPPTSHRAAVPGLLDAMLAAHNRFGVAALGTLARAARDSVKEHTKDRTVRARLAVLDALPRHGAASLAKLGVHQAMLDAAGFIHGAVIGRDDLVNVPAATVELMPRSVAPHTVLVAPPALPARFAPPDPQPTPVGVAVAGDMHGTMAVAIWAIAPEAALLSGEHCLSLAALSTAPTKGVTRRTPGSRLPMQIPAALVRTDGNVWGAAAVAGEGELERARDLLVASRLRAIGAEVDEVASHSARGTTYWLVREKGDEMRAMEEAIRR